MRIYTTAPLNAGTPLDALRDDWITPTDRFFVRSHAEPPAVVPESYRLQVDGMVKRALSLSLADLARQFSLHTITAVLQCAGNRRRELNQHEPIDPSEIVWETDAVGSATWTGYRLRDVLEYAGVVTEAAHAAFAGLDRIDKTDDVFGASIPLDKALTPDVLLATAMNGEALTPDHGFPLRVVVPGYIGARSVKWLSSITVQAAPTENYFQSRAYRWFPPEVRAHNVVWEDGIPLGELPINAVICSPAEGETLPAGVVTLRGFALAQGDALIERVEVSLDDGTSWQTACLIGTPQRWAWCFWAFASTLAPGEHAVVVRAFDSAGHAQPADLSAVWNFKGYVNNAYHRVHFRVQDEA